MSKAPQLASQLLENISRSALEKYQQILSRFAGGISIPYIIEAKQAQ
jgi:hypothetical protein